MQTGNCIWYLGPEEELLTGKLLHMQGLINLHSGEAMLEKGLTTCIPCCNDAKGALARTWCPVLSSMQCRLFIEASPGACSQQAYRVQCKHPHAALP